jgi:hypothetical protein
MKTMAFQCIAVVVFKEMKLYSTINWLNKNKSNVNGFYFPKKLIYFAVEKNETI